MGICQRHGFPHAFGKNPSVIASGSEAISEIVAVIAKGGTACPENWEPKQSRKEFTTLTRLLRHLVAGIGIWESMPLAEAPPCSSQ